MVFQGAELASRVDEILYKYKLLLRKKGMMSVRGLRTWFRHIDEDKSKRIEQIELEQALNREGIFPSRDEMQALMAWFDTNGDGGINLDEFITGLADKLSPRATAAVRKIFEKLDRDKSGALTIEDIQQVYRADHHPLVQSGAITKKDALTTFLHSFEGPRGNRDGTVTWNEFQEYYGDVRFNFPNDNSFIHMLDQCWAMCEQLSVSDKEELRAVFEKIRNKLMLISDKGKDEHILQSIFRSIDTNGDGKLSAFEMQQAILKLGIAVDKKLMEAVHKDFDNDGDGQVDYREFARFVCDYGGGL